MASRSGRRGLVQRQGNSWITLTRLSIRFQEWGLVPCRVSIQWKPQCAVYQRSRHCGECAPSFGHSTTWSSGKFAERVQPKRSCCAATFLPANTGGWKRCHAAVPDRCVHSFRRCRRRYSALLLEVPRALLPLRTLLSEVLHVAG